MSSWSMAATCRTREQRGSRRGDIALCAFGFEGLLSICCQLTHFIGGVRRRNREMPAAHFFAERPEEIGLNPDKVQALFDRAEREIKEGLLPACQLAIARNDKIGLMRTLGRAIQGGVEKPATDETFFDIMSCTKAL